MQQSIKHIMFTNRINSSKSQLFFRFTRNLKKNIEFDKYYDFRAFYVIDTPFAYISTKLLCLAQFKFNNLDCPI